MSLAVNILRDEQGFRRRKSFEGGNFVRVLKSKGLRGHQGLSRVNHDAIAGGTVEHGAVGLTGSV